MPKTRNKKRGKKSNKTRKVGGVREPKALPKKGPNNMRVFNPITNVFNKLSPRIRRTLARNPTTTNLPRLLLTQPTITLVRVITTSVYSRVLLVKTEIGYIILKICVITPESEQLSTIARPGVYKQSISESDFEKEYEYLLENSSIDICPEPHFIDIYEYDRNNLPDIIMAIREQLNISPDESIGRALHETFIDMAKLAKKGHPVKYGIIGMDYIDGHTLDFYWRNRVSNKRMIIKKICILLLLLHMNGYSNYDCNPTNIIIRILDNTPFMIDFGECYPRSEGLNNPIGNGFDGSTTDDDIIDFYISKIGVLPFEREFLRKFIRTNDKLTFEEISGHLRVALYCIYHSSPVYEWMNEYDFFDFINDAGFITSLQERLSEAMEES